MKTVRSPKFCSFGVFYFRVFPHYQKSKFASQKSKNKSIEKTFFYFPQKSGLCESYVILCCATGGNKNERNKRTMAREHRTARR